MCNQSWTQRLTKRRTTLETTHLLTQKWTVCECTHLNEPYSGYDYSAIHKLTRISPQIYRIAINQESSKKSQSHLRSKRNK